MSDMTWRAAQPSDAAAVADLFATVARTAPIGLETDVVEVRSRLSRPGLDLGQDTLVGITATGTALAYAETADMGVGQGQLRIRLTSALHPDLRADAARRTHDWLLERAGQLHRQRRPELPGVLGTRCAATDHARLALLTDAGFEVFGWHQDLVRPVREPLSPAPVPPGIMIVAYQRRYDEATRVAHNDAYAKNPAALLPDPQTWPQHAVGLPNFLPEASFLALADTTDGPDIVAFLFSLHHHDITGSQEGSLHCLGTRIPWRRRGLATTLISRALTAYRHAGYTQARLQVDTSNTNAVNLYTTAGFTDSGRGYAMLRTPIH